MFNFFRNFFKRNKKPTKIGPYASPEELSVGVKVIHIKFGQGEIIEIDERAVATIRFKDSDKRIMLEYAKLQIVK